MTEKNLFLLLLFVFLLACDNGDSGTAVDNSDIVSLQVESFDDLPNCSKNREGDLAEVQGERKAYRCLDGIWEFDHDVYDSVATEDDLPACTAKKEGSYRFVTKEKSAFYCDGTRWSKVEKKPADLQEYESEDDLLNCSKNREGEKAYVADVEEVFVCSDGVWSKDDESEDLDESSSSSANKPSSISSSTADEQDEEDVGPVSQYGQLQVGKNSKGEGRIYGSCKSWSTSGKEVQVRGLSLYWSINKTQASSFWTKGFINGLVSKLKIELIRAPMGVDENFGDGNYFTNKTLYQQYLDQVVQTAIENDIYVIIDYHSHKAHDNVAYAQEFFERMAEKWGGYDNVIFEIFNEPACLKNGSGNCETSSYGGGFLPWSTIKTYAEKVIPTIRKYSDNLIIVGTPKWDQQPNAVIDNEVADEKNNTAYAFHYYAGTHTIEEEGANAEEAMQAGLSLFVSEWGTVNASGDGSVASANASWQTWMDSNKLSSANWSVSSLAEGASFFTTSGAWNYSTSGTWVKNNVLANIPGKYTKCGK